MQGIQAMHISQAMLNARLLQATEVLRCSMLVVILVQQLLQVSHLPLEVWPGEAALHDDAQHCAVIRVRVQWYFTYL